MKIALSLILVIFFGILSAFGEPLLKDQDLIIDEFISEIPNHPTTMAFVGDDILVLTKNDGQVHLIRDGKLQDIPVLDVKIANSAEQGMLGITTTGSVVYLYFTESTKDGGDPIANRIYRYDWNESKLVNPVLIKSLPSKTSNHNGGAMVTGLDGSVYAVIGDQGTHGILQNRQTGGMDDTSVILRISPEGPYYAMGIRNSFGLAIDPVTGYLWDTENGMNDFDEINLVQPNFNSGWELIMGPATESELAILPGYDGYVYSDPEFSWQEVVAPTAISFVDSEPFEKYENSVFVGDCIYGNLYKFELNSDRTGFVFTDPELSDDVANTGESIDEIIFGTGFGCITDIETGPDGFLYVVSLSDGVIYKIMPTDEEIDDIQTDRTLPEYPVYGIVAALIIIGIVYFVKSRNKKA